MEVPIYLLSFRYPFDGPKKLRFPHDLGLIPKAKVAIHDTIQGLHEVVNWVRQRPGVDQTRTILVGASFGAPLVSIVAGENPDITALILVHGFGNVPKTITHRLAAKWEPKYGFLGKWVASIFSNFLWWYVHVPSPEEQLAKLRSHQHVLLLTAQADDLLPPEALISLRHALQESQSRWEEQICQEHILELTKMF